MAYSAHCAAIHPARLVRGLADAVRAKGVAIYEQCPVLDLEPGRVRTPHGMVKADVVLRATEGYSDTLPSQRRRLLPIYSMMVATEPLPDSVWDGIGLKARETFGDGRRLVIYGQRTLDNRFAFGGRAGYYFGSEMKPVIDPAEPLLDKVEATLRGLFPPLKDYRVTHRWGGLMGTSTTWRPSVTFDKASGVGAAGGYVGEGVAASNLAGRVLADLVTDRKTDLTRLAWVNDTARRWVPEPLRWLGVKSIRYIGSRADAEEFETGQPSKLWGGLYSKLLG
jgi:glycine/D-amino acid oxidase-like deaminating enzyme